MSSFESGSFVWTPPRIAWWPVETEDAGLVWLRRVRKLTVVFRVGDDTVSTARHFVNPYRAPRMWWPSSRD